MSARYSMSRKGRKAKAEQKKVKNYLGRVIRDIDNKKGDLKNNSKLFQALLRAKLIYNQQRTDKNKIYSWHEDVSCIVQLIRIATARVLTKPFFIIHLACKTTVDKTLLTNKFYKSILFWYIFPN